MRAMTRNHTAMVALLTLLSGALAFDSASAEPGSCITDRGCLNRAVAGSGENYRIASDDPDLSNNYYSSESFPKGDSVNDRVSSIRNRRSTATRFCSYRDFNYVGSVYGNAPYLGATWVNASGSQNSSSARFRGALC
jgi:hypothetical protein